MRPRRQAALAAVMLLSCLVAVASAQSEAPGFCRKYCPLDPDPYGSSCKNVCAAADCNARRQNIQGELLVLDIGSFDYTRGGTPTGGVPAACCEVCRNTTGCNAWVYCDAPEGCGSGCAAYVSQQPQYGSSSRDAGRLPLTNFGSFRNCNGDKWPQGMCSLKRVADVSKPPLAANGAGEGWIAGVVPKPATAGCPAGFSAAQCAMCKASKAPQDCFTCIQKVQRLGDWDYCGVCASLGSAAKRDACTQCLVAQPISSGLGCSACVTASWPPTLQAADQCFDCVVAAPPGAARNGSVCANCYGPGPTSTNLGGQGAAACVACVTGPSNTSSWGRTGCAQCASWTSTDPGSCNACLATAKTSDDVDGCTACAASRVPVAGKAGCYGCVAHVRAGAAKSSCAEAFVPPAAGSKAFEPARLVACLARVPAAAPDSAASDAALNCTSCLYNPGVEPNQCLDSTNT